MFYTTATVLN